MNFYAAFIKETIGDCFDAMFGPVYKGIPLVTTTAGALARNYQMDKPLLFNRKKSKTTVKVEIPLATNQKTEIV